MFKKYPLLLLIGICALAISGCLEQSSNYSESDNPTSADPPATPPPATPPPDVPPIAVLSTIPDVPFDHMKIPGATTSSGSLPTTILAGEVLAFTGQTTSGDLTINCQGTEQDPAFIVGGTLSGQSDVIQITGSWCYFIDTEFFAMQPRPTGDHIVFRGVNVHGSDAKNGMNLSGSHIVVIESEVHHNQRTTEDAHGIQISQGASNIWVLNNSIHHNSGDSLQGCHGCLTNPPENIYIGGNLFYSDRENGVDFKYINNVIVEGNVFHSYAAASADAQWCFDDGSRCGIWNSGSDGSAIVIGSDGVPNGVLIKDNEILSAVNAIRIEEGIAISIIGNVQHDISGRCLQLDKNGERVLYQDNVCRASGRGIYQNWRDNFSLDIDGNVFEDISGPAIEYEARIVCEASTLTSNEFRATGPLICASTIATSTEQVNALPGAAGNVVF